MTYAEAFKNVNYLQIVELYATNKNTYTLEPLKTFMRRKHKLPKEVINGLVFYVLFTLKGKLPLKESYYRVIQDDWVSKKIVNAQVMLDYFRESLQIRKNMEEQKQFKESATVSAKRRVVAAYQEELDQYEHDPEVMQALGNVAQKFSRR